MRTKRIFFSLIALLMTVSMLVACSGQAPAASQQPATEAPAASEAPAATVAPAASEAPADATASEAPAAPPSQTGTGEAWMEPYPETVTVTIVNNDSKDYGFAQGEDIYNNLWTKEWKKDLNIDVKTLWVSTDYETKLNLSIAAADLPDMFYTNNVQFAQLEDANLLADIKPSFDKYKSAMISKMYEQDDPDITATAMRDGKMYGMPQLHYGYECSTYWMWIKKNWYEAAGKPEIKTVAQFEDLMKTFKEKNNSPFAMPLDKTLEPFFYMAPAFHAYPKIWLDDGTGKIVYGGIQDAMKPMLQKWADWYKQGLLRSDFATLDNAAMVADVLNSKVGVIPGENWYSWVIQDTYKNGGDGTWLEAYFMPSVDDKPVMSPIPFVNTNYDVVNAKCEHPEVLVKLIDHYAWLLNEAVPNGEKKIEEVLPFTSNNMHHVTGPFKVTFHSYADIKEVIHAVDTGEQKFSTGYAYAYYAEIEKWYKNKDATSLGRLLQMGQDQASLVLATQLVDNNQLLKSKLWGLSPQALLDNGTTLDDLLIEGYTQIIMGEKPVDYFDTLVQTWKDAGGQDATDAVNQMYAGK